jgi:hypothetical protein
MQSTYLRSTPNIAGPSVIVDQKVRQRAWRHTSDFNVLYFWVSSMEFAHSPPITVCDNLSRIRTRLLRCGYWCCLDCRSFHCLHGRCAGRRRDQAHYWHWVGRRTLRRARQLTRPLRYIQGRRCRIRRFLRSIVYQVERDV